MEPLWVPRARQLWSHLIVLLRADGGRHAQTLTLLEPGARRHRVPAEGVRGRVKIMGAWCGKEEPLAIPDADPR